MTIEERDLQILAFREVLSSLDPIGKKDIRRAELQIEQMSLSDISRHLVCELEKVGFKLTKFD